MFYCIYIYIYISSNPPNTANAWNAWKLPVPLGCYTKSSLQPVVTVETLQLMGYHLHLSGHRTYPYPTKRKSRKIMDWKVSLPCEGTIWSFPGNEFFSSEIIDKTLTLWDDSSHLSCQNKTIKHVFLPRIFFTRKSKDFWGGGELWFGWFNDAWNGAVQILCYLCRVQTAQLYNAFCQNLR